jgi:hypothetical protein
MDILSLLSLLQSERLHFTNLKDLFRFDVNEGTGGLSINVARGVFLPSGFFPLGMEEPKVPATSKLPQWRKKVKEWDKQNANVFISCWHMNDIDSDFMWRVYAKLEYGVAVVSCGNELVDSFKGIDKSKIGYARVDYPFMNHVCEGHSEMGNDAAFLIKHPQFEPEREFRVFLRTKETDVQSCDLEVNLQTLIKEIRISPLMPSWAERALRDTLDPICEARGIPAIYPPLPLLR